MIIFVRLSILIVLWRLLIPCSPAAYAADRGVTMLAVGDIMLGRHIAKVMRTNGGDLPFHGIAPTLQSADIVFGNLEAVIAGDGSAPAFPEKPYSFHADKAAARSLGKAGFHLLGLANNHALDYGPSALFETRRLLREQGIVDFGAGKDIIDARRPAVLSKNGVRFGVLGYGVAHSRAVYAKKDKTGIAPIIMEHIQKDIQTLR
ncbi:MAG TPA: CapA family protein, partial [Nitrospirota bacterium]